MTYWQAFGYIGVAIATGLAIVVFAYVVEGVIKWRHCGRR